MLRRGCHGGRLRGEVEVQTLRVEVALQVWRQPPNQEAVRELRAVRGISRSENSSKRMTLLDDQMAYVGADCFPASWGGEVPTEEQRQAFYQSVKIRPEAHDEEDDESDSD